MHGDLDIQPLTKAIRSLKAGLAEYARNSSNDVVRDGCIQRFEFTYEVSHKMLRRFLEATSADPDGVAALSFPDLIRTGAERGLLRDGWPRWKDFRKARSLTSHTYDEVKAREVFSAIPGFLDEAVYLQARLQAELAV